MAEDIVWILQINLLDLDELFHKWQSSVEHVITINRKLDVIKTRILHIPIYANIEAGTCILATFYHPHCSQVQQLQKVV